MQRFPISSARESPAEPLSANWQHSPNRGRCKRKETVGPENISCLKTLFDDRPKEEEEEEEEEEERGS